MATYHEHLKKRMCASKTAPQATEATQRKINRVRSKDNKSNAAVIDPITNTDRSRDGTRKGVQQGAVTLTYKADYSPHAGTDPRTGVALDPLSGFTRPQIYLCDAEMWQDLRDKVKLAKTCKKQVMYLVRNEWGGTNVITPRAPHIDFMVARRHDGRWVAYRCLKDGTLALVSQLKAKDR